jgi:hypothetical protein
VDHKEDRPPPLGDRDATLLRGVNGLLLKKDRIGWCQVHGVTGATGCAG